MNAICVGVLILIGAHVLHLAEEVLTGFRQKYPLGAMSKSVFVSGNALVFVYALAIAYLSEGGTPIAVPLAWVYGIGMLLNGLLHLGMMVFKRAYFPGGITASVVLPAATSLIYQLASR
jgi:hypothetical protein